MASVTAALIPRTGFAHAAVTLDQLIATIDDELPLVVVEAGATEVFRRHVDAVAAMRPLRRVGGDLPLSPNAARNLAFACVDTEFVVFVDNDLVLAPGWLEPLLQCAQEANAWAVAPIILQLPLDDPTVHFATGWSRIVESDGTRIYDHGHDHPNQHPAVVRQTVHRGPSELVEFHCLVVRADAMRRIGPLDEGLVSALEECDFSLSIRHAGGEAWVEPGAQVVVTSECDRANLMLGLLRWSRARNRRSARHFARKYDLADPLGHRPTLRYSNRRRYRVFCDATGLPAPFAPIAIPLSAFAELRHRRALGVAARRASRRGG